MADAPTSSTEGAFALFPGWERCRCCDTETGGWTSRCIQCTDGACDGVHGELEPLYDPTPGAFEMGLPFAVGCVSDGRGDRA